MSIETLKARIPDYAKDIKLNLSGLLGGIENTTLKTNQIGSLALVSAYATKQQTVIQLFEVFAKEQGLSDHMVQAVRSAATMMAMNNIYYRSVHWIKDDTYQKLPTNLRMHALQRHGIDQKDFELYCVAASAINGCERCLDAHIGALQKVGMDTLEIQYSLRLASVIQAFAQVIVIEEANA